MLPSAFLSRMECQLGQAYPAFAAACSGSAVRALHLNLFKITPARFLAESGIPVSPIPYATDGFYLETEGKLGQHPLHHAGAFYLQEPSAMTPVCAAPLTPGMKVLDLCASPGGKSTQIANRIGGNGLLVANEIVPSRAAVLAGNIERMGLRNAVVTSTDSGTLGRLFPGFFDAVLVDAPCSGEGMFRRVPEAADEWSPASTATSAARQRQILSEIVPALRPGGYLIYSTCTFSREENEETVLDFLRTHPDFSQADIPNPIKMVTVPGEYDGPGIDASLLRRFYPHTGRGEGQFLALFRRSGDAAVGSVKAEKEPPLPRGDLAAATEFFKDVLTEMPESVPSMFRGSAVLAPALPPIPEKLIVSRGVPVGALQKGRMIPHHSFFSAYGQIFRRQIPLGLDDERLALYLHGDTFQTNAENGWNAVTVCGCPLGGVKVGSGTAKNHYPKGLRRANPTYLRPDAD